MMDGKDVVQTVESFASLLGNIEEHWDFLNEEIHTADLRQNDLLHVIEGEQGKYLNAGMAYKKYKELKELRNYRRALKNEQALLEPLYKWYQANKAISIKLFKTKTAMQSQQRRQENWVYIPRVGVQEEGLAE